MVWQYLPLLRLWNHRWRFRAYTDHKVDEMQHTPLSMGQLAVTPGQATTLFTVRHTTGGFSYQVTAPVFEVEGNQIGSWTYISNLSLQPLARGGQQTTLRYDSTALSGLKLLVDIRFFPDSPVLRLRYRLESQTTMLLTKHTKRDSLCYLMATADLAEIQLSHFDPVVHSYLPHIERGL